MLKIGKYELAEKIGVGGFGEVYKGRDPFIKRLVAVKTCTSNDQDIRNRFFQEAEIAGNLHHKNITIVYDFGIQDDLPYLIQEYLSGEDLDRKIKRRDYLPYPEKLYYLLQIARGLAYAHDHGVIHRDIKPANIRILEDGTAKIMDFGIAKLAQQETGLTQTGMTLGTAAYLAPEQIRGDPVDHRTDVFSFGVLAYELLTYERPFRGKQISQVLHQILSKEPPPITDCWPAAPPEMVAFIDCCLQKDIHGRYADGATLVQELERIQKQGRAARQKLEETPTVKLDSDEMQPSQAVQAPVATAPAAPAPQAQADLPTAPPEPRQVGAPGPTSRTLDDIGFDFGIAPAEPEPPPKPAPARRSNARSIAILAILAAVAVAAGWWFGAAPGSPFRSPADGAGAGPVAGGPGDGEPIDVAPPPGETGDGAPEDTSADGGSPGGATRPEDPEEPAAAAETPPEAPPVVEEAAPQPGTIRVPAVGWSDKVTAEVLGREAVLTLQRDFEQLQPGTYDVTFEVQDFDYPVKETRKVVVKAGEVTTVASPILQPGALSIRPMLQSPQGEIWLDGEALGKSQISNVKKAPGEYRIEIRPQSGEQDPVSKTVVIESGMEDVVTYDLNVGEVRSSEKAVE